MPTDHKSYERYVAWCQVLGIRPLCFTAWIKHATEILCSLTETGDANYAKDAAGFWLSKHPGPEERVSSR